VVAETLTPQFEQLAPDPLIAPPGVLLSQAEDQLSDHGIEGGTSGRAAWSGPLRGDELPVPPEQGLGADEERVPRLSRKGPTRGALVGCAVNRSLHLPAQDGDLVSQHDVLEFRLSSSALVRPEQAEDAAQKEEEDGPDHGAALSQLGLPQPVSGRDRVSGPHGLRPLVTSSTRRKRLAATIRTVFGPTLRGGTPKSGQKSRRIPAEIGPRCALTCGFARRGDGI
jgi:hypothetical protein